MFSPITTFNWPELVGPFIDRPDLATSCSSGTGHIYILFKIPTMTHSLFTGGTGGHGGGLGLAMMAIRGAM